jgi:hypothetical protein
LILLNIHSVILNDDTPPITENVPLVLVAFSTIPSKTTLSNDIISPFEESIFIIPPPFRAVVLFEF